MASKSTDAYDTAAGTAPEGDADHSARRTLDFRKLPQGVIFAPSSAIVDSVPTASRQETGGKGEDTERRDRIWAAVCSILECTGDDPAREGLANTPARCAKAMMFFTSGYRTSIADIVNDAIFNESYGGMITVKNIEIHSLCEHHLLPFHGKMSVGYIPNGKIIGLSKIPRIASVFARRLQVQERLTFEVASSLNTVLKPHGVMVVMRAAHLCMAMRGVEQADSLTTTSSALGCFESDPNLRSEFLNLVNMH
ncbi:hypothetical protein PWT90_06635 [Aphanocladium album]|nr:hypothetical protein PWT90_06635 [Aphanocladium album]